MAGPSTFRYFAAVCLFSILGLMASIYIVDDTLLYNRKSLKTADTTRIYVLTSKITSVSKVNTTMLTTSAANDTDQVTLHCNTVCSGSAGGICVPLDLAVFVYKNDTPTENMTFDLQSYNPVIHVAKRRDTPRRSLVLKMDRCNLEKHFPGVELIPRQASCAVVGNSGILNNSSCGDCIDSYDFVIRANMGLIKGYETDVGKKSSLNAFNRATVFTYGNAMGRTNSSLRDKLFDHIQTLKESILWYPKQLYHRGSFISGRKYRIIIDAIRKKGFTGIRFAFSAKPIHVERSWGLHRTGTLGLDMYSVARTFCSNITLFGFYPFYEDLEGRPVKYHYYDEVKFNYSRNKGHQFSLEHTKLKDLERRGKLTLVVRDCKPRIHR